MADVKTDIKEVNEPKPKPPTDAERMASLEFKVARLESKLNIQDRPAPGEGPVPLTEGKIVSVGTDRFVVEHDDGTQTFHKVGTDADATMNGKAVKLKDIKADDRVKVTGRPSGMSSKIEVTRGKE